MNQYELTYKPFGTSAILVEWPSKIDENIIQDIVAFENSMEKGKGILDTVIAYNSLTIRYDHKIDYKSEVAKLKEQYKAKNKPAEQNSKCWQIPVCYDTEFGLDLTEIAETKKLSVEKVIELHTNPSYLIYFLGFQPGFLYLGGLDDQIHTPRRASPRLRVAKGSVGIGGAQTGVYPQQTSGGWNILGKSPINFFDITKEQPCFAKAGDRIQFVSIDRETFHEIAAEEEKGNYELKFQSL
ncbi:5-oxoprolinase subunit PxpB [Salibacter halophilus]|uniref:5-oxoprolinase subunit PxpB n=1 Tax=Salibacter halophilus TaxID=1803916 RepID=A0A6N6MAT3_9FLAO|nr:5-oxoprolinase subunit PxpB [Salibacter halophilus]KAB1065946.1 5-oxoprolinase subunit PxpB [Salibacter halophilus]